MLRQIATLAVAVTVLAGCAGSGDSGDHARFEQGREAYLAGDYGEAFERLIVEAEAGNPEAQYTIGYMYFEGQGVSRDESRGLEWIRRAADNGSRHAVSALGELAGMGHNRPGVADEPEEVEAAPDAQPDTTGDADAPRLTPDPDTMEREIREELPAELTDDS